MASGYNVSTMAPNKGYGSLIKTAITSSADPMAGKHTAKLPTNVAPRHHTGLFRLRL